MPETPYDPPDPANVDLVAAILTVPLGLAQHAQAARYRTDEDLGMETPETALARDFKLSPTWLVGQWLAIRQQLMTLGSERPDPVTKP